MDYKAGNLVIVSLFPAPAHYVYKKTNAMETVFVVILGEISNPLRQSHVTITRASEQKSLSTVYSYRFLRQNPLLVDLLLYEEIETSINTLHR